MTLYERGHWLAATAKRPAMDLRYSMLPNADRSGVSENVVTKPQLLALVPKGFFRSFRSCVGWGHRYG
jgi:hypothetical protein